ncbi:hypothetical protein DYQ86_13925 [Acidobacteria bacterium AB60]|nr:hypothetical protein DYQ86_13925 [Acidobacteria bacterium AB60]
MSNRFPAAGVFPTCAFVFALLVPAAPAQQVRDPILEGYVTSLNLPQSFAVNGQRVDLQPGATYGLQKDRRTTSESPLKDALQVGAYVFVRGSLDGKTKVVRGQTILFRDDWDRKLSGVGVITKMISGGPEPLFSADGYTIRITPATDLTFHGEINTIADVGVNTWLQYEGKRDRQGVLVATKAKFMRVASKPAKVLKGPLEYEMELQPPDFLSHKQGRVKMAAIGGWHSIPADKELQARVQRVGMRVVPAFQKQMTEDDPARIHFQFWAVDDEQLHEEFCSLTGGLILVSRQSLERLANDDQLAAVLADGVAFVIQRQGISRLVASRVALGEEAASLALMSFAPATALFFAMDSNLPNKQYVQQQEEQRARLALSLMADAGYDPKQAPEAWRLVAPKHLPRNLDSLKYPDRSGYQLGILNLQYRQQNSTAISPRP